MGNTISKLCACLCFVGAIAAFAPGCGGPSDGKDGECAEGQQKASVGGMEDCYDLCDNGMCAAGFECNSGICIAAGGTNNPNSGTNNPNSGTNNPNSGTNNPNSGTNNPNSGTNNPNSGTNNTNTMTEDYTAKCEQLAELLYGDCWATNCSGLPADFQMELDNAYGGFLNGGAMNEACADRAAGDAQFAQAVDEYLANVVCEDTRLEQCGYGFVTECGCNAAANVGAACAEDMDCQAGDLQPFCIQAQDENMMPTDFDGGYCVAVGCPTQGADPGVAYPSDLCGTDGVCVVTQLDMTTVAGICYDGCASNADCRDGYACGVTGLEANDQDQLIFLRSCQPACEANTDCGDMGFCNTTTGQCETECADEPLGGDPANGTLRDLCTNSGGSCADQGGTERCTLN